MTCRSDMPLVNFGDPRLPGRFWDKVAPCPMSGCWLWTGVLSTTGYGQIGAHSERDGKWRPRNAYRFAFEILVGAVPVGLELDHLCRVRSCVNPGHMEPVTHAENMARVPWGAAQIQLAKTHCPSGHPYSGSNLVVEPGARRCLTCLRNQQEFYRWRKRNGIGRLRPASPEMLAAADEIMRAAMSEDTGW